MTQRWSDLAQSEHIVLETFHTVMQQYDVEPGATLNDTEIQEAMIRAAAPGTSVFVIPQSGNRCLFDFGWSSRYGEDRESGSVFLYGTRTWSKTMPLLPAWRSCGDPLLLPPIWVFLFLRIGVPAFFSPESRKKRRSSIVRYRPAGRERWGSSDQYAYWSPAFLLDGETVITYSLPLVLDDTCLGILGIELILSLSGYPNDRIGRRW